MAEPSLAPDEVHDRDQGNPTDDDGGEGTM